jgi:hypothetical protein
MVVNSTVEITQVLLFEERWKDVANFIYPFYLINLQINKRDISIVEPV